jgi:hypothetical protein
MSQYPYEDVRGSCAPVVVVEVEGEAATPGRCRAVVDSGISISGIPRKILDDVKASPAPGVSIVTVLGNRQVMPRYCVTVALGDINRRLQVLPLDQDVALLGRDFLEDCIVLLEGKEKVLSIARLERVGAYFRDCENQGRLRVLPAPVKRLHLGIGPDYCMMELVLDLSGHPGEIIRFKPEYVLATATMPSMGTLLDKVFIFGATEDDLILNFDRFLQDPPIHLVRP